MRRTSPLLSAPLLLAACLLAACDWIAATQEAVETAAAEAAADDGAHAASEAPEGWESLDDEGAATRLYYQFVDAQRRVRFVERLEDVPEAWRDSVGFVKMDVPPPLTPGDAAAAREAQVRHSSGTRVASAAASGPGVVLYSAEWCGACRKAKRWLDAQGVDYELRDIDQPRHAEALLRLTGRRAVPVIDVGGRVLTGFSASSYERLIDRA